MKKTFVTSISLQRRQGTGGLEKVLYEPEGFQMSKNRESSFPIIPVISEHMSSDLSENRVIVILPGNPNIKTNYDAFLGELAELGIRKELVKEIRPGENLGRQGSIKVLMELLDQIPDESNVYTDITYNTKPMSVMQVYAMHLVEKIKNSEVSGIFYGEYIPGTSQGAKLHDITVFKNLLDISNQLEILGISDIRETLRHLTGE